MENSAKVRLVKCPKCQKLLPELADYSVYQCGCCGVVLRAKHRGYGNCSLSETSDEGEIRRDPAKSENSMGKGVADLSDNSDVDVDSNGGSSRYGQRDSEKAKNGHERYLKHSDDGHEKGHLENGFDVDIDKDEWGSKSIGRDHEEHESHMGHEKGSKFSERISNWRIGERDEMGAFWRKPSADMEGVRFSTLNYPDEGTSNNYSSFSNSYGEQWRNDKGMDGLRRVQHLEQDRAELLRKLDELTNQLSQSAELASNPKEPVFTDGRMVPPDPYGGSDAWFSDGSSELNNRTSRQFFGPNNHAVYPPYFNYRHVPQAYTSGNEMAMHNFHPSMHNPNYVPGHGDPFTSQMRRGPNQLSHPFPQQLMHPYFPRWCANTNPDSYEPYAHNGMLHPPSCSCFLCYHNKQRGTVPPPPASFINGTFPNTPNDPMLFHHEIPGAFGPSLHDSRTAIPPVSLHGNQLHARLPNDFNSELGGFVQSRSQKILSASGFRHCYPIAGGSPFITCYNCFELLQLPNKALVKVKNFKQKLRCGACSSELSFVVINKKLVVSPHSEMKKTTMEENTKMIDDRANEVVNSTVSHSYDRVNSSGVNFSSDDYAGYDFHSVDRESSVLAAGPSLNSNKPQEMQSFNSSSLSASEDENSLEVMISRGEVKKSIHQPTKASLPPRPSSAPLQEHFDYSDNNHAVNRFGKGNQSQRLEQEKGKLDKVTSRQNSFREVVLATEMDVHDYSNSGTSQDSSQEHDHPRSNKGGESFFARFMKKDFRDSSQSNRTDDGGECKVTVNGQPLSDHVIKKAEKLAGPIRPGNYWYDCRAGFWGVIGGPCLGIIPPFIEEFNYPMPDKCSGGNTGIFVNDRELNQKDLDLLSGRGLPRDSDRSYIVEISGRVLDADTGEQLDSLGKLAPTVEKARHGFGMKVPRSAAK